MFLCVIECFESATTFNIVSFNWGLWEWNSLLSSCGDKKTFVPSSASPLTLAVAWRGFYALVMQRWTNEGWRRHYKQFSRFVFHRPIRVSRKFFFVKLKTDFESATRRVRSCILLRRIRTSAFATRESAWQTCAVFGATTCNSPLQIPAYLKLIG